MTTTLALVKISGNTYPVKDELKKLGAKWDAADKCWLIASDKADKARAIVEAAGPKKPYSGSGRGNSGFRGRSEYTRRGGMRGCSACSAAGGMCRQCAFDEYDN